MVYEIIWAPAAKRSFFNILNYLEENWTQREVDTFIQRSEEIIDLIRAKPSLFQYSRSSDTHRCVLSPQTSLFYRVNSANDHIELLVFWDNRQDPDKLTLLTEVKK